MKQCSTTLSAAAGNSGNNRPFVCSWAVDAWNKSGAKEVSITVRTSSDKELDDRSLKIVRIRL